MNLQLMQSRLQLLTNRNNAADAIGSPSTFVGLGKGRDGTAYTAGTGINNDIGLLTGRIKSVENALAYPSTKNPAHKAAYDKLLARSQEHKRTLVQQAMYETTRARQDLTTKLAIRKAYEQELASCEAALKSFDADNPDLANLSDTDLEQLIATMQAESANPNEAPPERPTTDNPQVRLNDEATTQAEEDATIQALLDNNN